MCRDRRNRQRGSRGIGRGLRGTDRMSALTAPHPRARLARASLLYVAWVAMAGTGPLDLVIGLPVAGLAAWASLLLVPQGDRRLSVAGLARLALRFPGQSLAAGIDVARRAFDPRLPIRPGLVICPTSLQAGLSRDAFLGLMSLQPGSLPVAERVDGTVLVHALDTAEPIAARFAAEEVSFKIATGAAEEDGGATSRG
jgi:multicomponent Na+:H+ antiporter subunit E